MFLAGLWSVWDKLDALALGVTSLTLSSGTRIGAFVLSTPIGVGGMGEVYRARDTTLDRDVAIKILPPGLATDAERLARFRREAHVLAALNHPNIATIHGIEESGAVHALVLELVEGPTLEDWLAARSQRRSAGNLMSRDATAETIAVARQIAEALDFAHERGIVHRDLKPANVKVAPDGRVKVLDFGLAKIREPESGTSYPTATGLLTDAGVVLGTVPYMSPEQARGSAVDRRTDIWAFGCILYELLTGRPAFPSGETASDTLAAVLARDPDWTALPTTTPPRLRHLVERCLQKDPRQRLRDIGDALLELQEPYSDVAAKVPSPARSRWREYGLGAVALIGVAGAAFLSVERMRGRTDERMVAFVVQAPLRGPLTVGQPLSPDGRKIAFIAASSSGVPVIWIRSVDSIATEPLAGTEGALDLFWSPDSQHLGFFTDGRLQRIPVSGGAPQVICSIAGPQGGSWGSGNVILIGSGGPIMRVSAAGGTPTPVTVVNQAAGEQWHTSPDFLPDGRRFIFVVLSGGLGQRQAYVANVDDPSDRRELAGIRSTARYASTGHLLFIRNYALLAHPFDLDALELSGEPFLVAAGAAPGPGEPQMQAPFSASNDGSLAYRPLADTQTELWWFNRTGARMGLAAPRAQYLNPELSRDGSRIAVDIVGQNGPDIWTIDMTTGIRTPVVTEPSADFMGAWSPDNREVAFTSYRAGLGRIYRRAVGGVVGDTLVQETTLEQRVSDWSSDGRWLLYAQEEPTAGNRDSLADLWAVGLEGDAETIRLTRTEFAEEGTARFSPDVNWVAYESLESGEAGSSEIYVQSFPRADVRYQVSKGGGRAPRWSPDGAELFYVMNDGTVMAVPVRRVAGDDRFDAPMSLFRADVAFSGLGRVLNVSPDRRFLLSIVPADRASSSIVVLHNWAKRLDD
jgi:Tol biopolymer transport system component